MIFRRFWSTPPRAGLDAASLALTQQYDEVTERDLTNECSMRHMNGIKGSPVAANETHPETAPLAANGPDGQLGAVACMRHMTGGNPLELDGLADDVTAPTRVLRSLYHHFTITLQSFKN